MSKKQLKITCNFHVSESNYSDTITKLENIIETIKDKFEQKCICIARIEGKYVNTYILPYDKTLFETIDYNIDYFSVNGENVIIEVDYLTNLNEKTKDDYYRNALDISWYRGTRVNHIFQDIIPTDDVDHKIIREYPHDNLLDFFTNGDITEDEDEIPFD